MFSTVVSQSKDCRIDRYGEFTFPPCVLPGFHPLSDRYDSDKDGVSWSVWHYYWITAGLLGKTPAAIEQHKEKTPAVPA